MTTTTRNSELTGRRLGVFRLEAPLGKGGMGMVYRGVDTALERPVAVKVLAPALAADPEYVERFVREARTAARISHPHVVQIYGAGFEDGVAYMALELVTGGSLAHALARSGPLPIHRACQVVRDVARGLAAAHALGIVHRDLKPDNILITADGVVKLADFGLARSVSGQRITQSGAFLGTPQYCSPEQCNGLEVGFASDLYSLGVILYELLAGRPPHEAPTPLALFKKILVEDVPPIRSVRPDVPPSLVAILGRLLQKDPAARYPSAVALAHDLDLVLAGLPGAGQAAAPARAPSPGSEAVTVVESPTPAGSRAAPFEESVVGPPIVVPASTPAPASPAPAAPPPGAAEPEAPRRRRSRVALVALVGAVALLVGGALATSGLIAPTRPARVAVLQWHNKTDSDEFAWLAVAIPEFVTAELTAARIEVAGPGRADFSVDGSFYESGSEVVLRAEVRGPDGAIVYSRRPRSTPKSAVLADMSALAQEVAEALRGREVVDRDRGPAVLASARARARGAADLAEPMAPPAAPAPRPAAEAKAPEAVAKEPEAEAQAAIEAQTKPLVEAEAERAAARLEGASAAAETEAAGGALPQAGVGVVDDEAPLPGAPAQPKVWPQARSKLERDGTRPRRLIDHLRAAGALDDEWELGRLIAEALGSGDREALEAALDLAERKPAAARFVRVLRLELARAR